MGGGTQGCTKGAPWRLRSQRSGRAADGVAAAQPAGRAARATSSSLSLPALLTFVFSRSSQQAFSLQTVAVLSVSSLWIYPPPLSHTPAGQQDVTVRGHLRTTPDDQCEREVPLWHPSACHPSLSPRPPSNSAPLTSRRPYNLWATPLGVTGGTMVRRREGGGGPCEAAKACNVREPTALPSAPPHGVGASRGGHPRRNLPPPPPPAIATTLLPQHLDSVREGVPPPARAAGASAGETVASGSGQGGRRWRPTEVPPAAGSPTHLAVAPGATVITRRENAPCRARGRHHCHRQPLPSDAAPPPTVPVRDPHRAAEWEATK